MLRRLRLALATEPNRQARVECAIATIAIGAIYVGVGLSTGLLHVETRTIGAIAPIAIIAFFAPALGEELVFRVALIPGRAESPHALGWILLSTAVFTAWHVVEAVLSPRAAATFLRADFLALATLIGLTCAVLRRRSSSIWTAVALHWIVVVGWIGWFGGPSLSELH